MDIIIKLLIIIFLTIANISVIYATYMTYKSDKEFRKTNKALEEAIQAELEKKKLEE